MLRVFEDSVLRNILTPEREEVTGNWMRLHNDELQNCIADEMLFGRSNKK